MIEVVSGGVPAPTPGSKDPIGGGPLGVVASCRYL